MWWSFFLDRLWACLRVYICVWKISEFPEPGTFNQWLHEYFTGTFGQTATLLQYCQHALILGIERLCGCYCKWSKFNNMHNNSTDACSCSWLAYEHCILMGWTNYMLRELIQPDCIISLPFNIWYDIIGFTNKFFVLIMWYNKLFRPKIFKKFIFHLWLWKPTLYLSTKKSFIFILNLWCFSCCRLMYAKVYLVHSRHGFFLMFYLQEMNCHCFLPYFDVYYWLSMTQLLSALGKLVHIFKTH